MSKKHQLLLTAKQNKRDEFYTQEEDIKKEIEAYKQNLKEKKILCPCDDPRWSAFARFFIRNFEALELKQLTCTCYAGEQCPEGYQDERVHNGRGLYCIVTRENVKNIDINRIQYDYLEGDGDFRSEEIKKLRDEADVIITNPPFSLARSFIQWITESEKKFLVIVPNTIFNKREVFPLVMAGEVYPGTGYGRKISGYHIPNQYENCGSEVRLDQDGHRIVSINQETWLTNIEHAKRPRPMKLRTMAENQKSLQGNKKWAQGYRMIDGMNIMNVPLTEAIPADYFEPIAVPITAIHKLSSEQFDILGLLDTRRDPFILGKPKIDGKNIFTRIVIKQKEPTGVPGQPAH